jgi:hypothetical protein
MKYGLILLLLSSACNFSESKIVYGNNNRTPGSDVPTSDFMASTAPAIIIQPHVVNKNQFAEQMYNVFSPDEITFTMGNAAQIKKEMSNSVWNSRYFITRNTGDELGKGCDPYVMAFNTDKPDLNYMDTWVLQTDPTTITNAKYSCHMVQASNVQTDLHASMPVGKIDVYAAVNKIRWCENLVASVSSGSVGAGGYRWHDYSGYDDFGISGFIAITNGATLASVALHKAFKTSSDPMDLTFNPDFTVDNIVKVVKLFYPSKENLEEAASVYLELDSIYPENGTTANMTKQRYEKWKVVISGTCQSLYWEIL